MCYGNLIFDLWLSKALIIAFSKEKVLSGLQFDVLFHEASSDANAVFQNLPFERDRKIVIKL
ncbi:MAG: hypothetical protein QY310_04040 [Candidatus Jettenia sp. CY-1]|nr:MAG: hypothetical protein QY310_04040 [Candidatus Jettenia sp. CY-1]